ncbi:MAG: hypothetical protein ACI3Y0_01555, partial [Prevotella sp.]
TAISNAQQAADAAKKVADEAAAAAKGAASDADAAKKAAAAAQTAADNAQAAADKAQGAADAVAADLKKAVENAASQIQEAVKNLATKDEVTAAVKVVADKYDAQAKELKTLSDRLDKVEAKLGIGEGGEDIDLTEIQKELDAIESDLKELIGDVSSMITSVELVYSSQDRNYYSTWMYPGTPNNLEFDYVIEQKRAPFGMDGDTQLTDKTISFVENATKYYGDGVLVRVNPVNAELNANNVSLINSKGEELRGLIDVESVERYSDNYYLMRSGVNETGLWLVKFKPADGAADWQLSSKFYSQNSAGQWGTIVYAVSVKNAVGTDTLNTSLDASRRVVSAYDVTCSLNYTDAYDGNPFATTENTVGITVKGKDIAEVKNRADQGTEYVWSKTEETYAGSGLYNTLTYTAPETTGANQNVTTGDDRSGSSYSYVVARVGEDIEIKFDENIKGFYVRLDYDFVESGSAPSEENAWNSYKYENVGTATQKAKMFEGSKGTIKVSSLSGEATGDVIGFRIYAVNLDGTLVDPDGIAFYVNLGDTGVNNDLGANNITVTSPSSNISPVFAFTKGIFKDITGVEWTVKLNNQTVGTEFDGTSGDYEALYRVDGDNNNWMTYAQAVTAGKLDKLDAVKFDIKSPTIFKDNETFTFSAVLQAQSSQGTTYDKSFLTAKLTKKLPTTAPAYKWNEGQTEEQIVKTTGYNTNIETALQIPASGNKDGNLNFNDMFIQSKSGNPSIASDSKFVFYLANTALNRDGNAYTEALEVNNTTTYNATIPAKLIDCATPHAVSTKYNYGAISSEYKWDGTGYDWIVNTTSDYSIKYMTWSYKNANYLGFNWGKEGNGLSGNNYKERTRDFVVISNTINIDAAAFATVYGSKLTTSLRKPTMAKYITDNWLKVVGVKTIGAETGIENPYYTWNGTSGTTITLNQKAGVENVPVHNEKVQITLQDCFGHKETHEFVLRYLNEDPGF